MITIENLKAHLNLDHDEDDALLQQKLDAATAWCASYVGVELADLDPIPAPFVEASLQLAAHFYENREAVSFGSSGREAPFSVVDMLNPLRKWAF